MSIQSNMDLVSLAMHTLATAEVVDNTYGKVSDINQALQSILHQLSRTGGAAALGQETADRLRELVTHVENNSLLFGIPERRWLIDSVLTAARQIRERLL